MSRKLGRLGLAVAFVLCTAYAYAPLWRAGFVGDDVPSLIRSSRAAWGVGASFESAARDPKPAGASDEARPVVGAPGVLGEFAVEDESLAWSSRLWSDRGRWSSEQAKYLRLENLALWIAGGVLLGLAVRRALLPWTGSDGARAAGFACVALLTLHPIGVTAVAHVGSRGALLALAGGAASGFLFLIARQERRSWPLIAAGVCAVAVSFAARAAWLLPPALAGLEFVSARRYRPFHTRLRTALTTLVCFGACIACQAAIAAFSAAPRPAFNVRAWFAELTLAGALQAWGEAIVALVCPVAPHVLTLGHIVAAVALVWALHPLVLAVRSAPRLWSTIVVSLGVAGLVTLIWESGVRVTASDWADVRRLLPSVVIAAALLGVASTALSGRRRWLVPLTTAALYAWMAHGVALLWPPASEAWSRLKADIDSARELHGRDASVLVIDPPGAVGGIDVLGGSLASMGDPALAQESPHAPPAGAALDPGAVGPGAGGAAWIRGLQAAAFFALVREPEFEERRERGVVLVFPSKLLNPSDAGDPTRASARLPRKEETPQPVVWRAEGRSPLLEVDPLTQRGVRVSALSDASLAEPPRIGWRAREGDALTGSGRGVWIDGEDGPVALFDLGRSFAWLAGKRIRRVWFEGTLSAIVSAKIVHEGAAPLATMVPVVRGDDWMFAYPERGVPTTVHGTGQWLVCLLDLSQYEYIEIAARTGQNRELWFPGAARFERHVLADQRGPVAWSLEYRVGAAVVARAQGRRREAGGD